MGKKIALVTGASSGIGQSLARLLAEAGHDLVLVARSTSKLEALGRDLGAAHGVACSVVSADLALPGAARSVFERTSELGLSVDVLVNDAGFGTRGDFLDLDLGTELEMIQVNAASLVSLCHLYGRGMRERGSGRILNVASTAGFQPGPFMATYFASKAFVISFSLALAHELEPSGVSVTCHCPGATDTPFAERAGNRNTRLFQRSGVATAEEVARHALRAMGRGERLAIPGALNRIGAFAVGLVPSRAVMAVVANLTRRLDGARQMR